MLKNLSNFIKSNKNRGMVDELDYDSDSKYTHFLRVKSDTEGVQLFYKFKNNKKSSIGVYESLEFEGIYDSINQLFYITGYWYPYLMKENGATQESVTVNGITFLRVESLVQEYLNNFKLKVISEIGTNEERVKTDVTEKELEYALDTAAVEIALDMFMKNKTSNELDMFHYVGLNKLGAFEYSGDLYLEFLGNSKEVINREAMKFIKEERKEIYLEILKTKQVKIEMEKLEKDKELLELRKILSILNDTSRKSLNVVLEVDGKEVACKIKTGKYGYNNNDYAKSDYIWEYDIVGADKVEDIKKFGKFLKETDLRDAPISSVKEISYSRKVLYSRD